MEEKYSVLMSVYKREKGAFLQQALNSIWEQSVPADDFVLVCDGPLTEELDAVIAEAEASHGEILHVHRLPVNGGLGNALNEGLKLCKNELVARMDSDDIAYPDRVERQLRVFAAHPEIGVCSGTVCEFSEDPNSVDASRVLPETHGDILEFAKSRNPFNHPCVMYRKSAVEAAGGYRDFYLLEDYYLWVRMLLRGTKGYNLPEPLLHMRAGAEMYKRRAGMKYASSQKKLFRFMKDQGFITTGQYLKSVIVRGGSALAPNGLRKFLFKKVLRK